jgi:hypothetical protein
MIKYVQFQDEKEERVVSEFCGPQDPEIHEFLGEINDDDPRHIEYVAFIKPLT